MRYRFLAWTLLGASIVAWPLAAHASYLSLAQQALKKGDLRGAEIDLRNAVRADPQNGEAHYWLGRVSLDLGDPVAGEREAQAAAARGFDARLAARLLGQSLLAQGKFNDVLQTMQPTGKNADLDATILVFRGYAEIGLKQPDIAQQDFQQAQKRAPGSVEPLLAEARLLISRGDIAGAEVRIDRAIAVQPKSPEALLSKGQLLRMKGDMTGALAVLDTLVGEQPSLIQARLDRAGLEIALKKVDAATKDLAVVQNAMPGNVQAIYLDAVVAAEKNNYAAADADLDRISGFIPRIARGYLLQAVVKEQLGQLQQAQEAAQRYLARAPNDLAAYKVLARIEFGLREPEQVIDTLEKVSATGKGDAETYDMLGRAYAAVGRDPDAVKAFEKAQTLAPNDVGVQTRLATVRMGMGQPGVAMGDLEHTLALAPKQPAVGEALFFAALATGDMNKATEALAKVRAAEGETPVVDNLTGLLQLAKLDVNGAKQTFTALIQKYPDFLPAQINLARVLAMQGDGAAAEQLLSKLLQKRPTTEPALTMLAADYAQSNRLPQATALLEAAHKASPDNVQIIATLGDLYIRGGDAQKALDLAGGVKGGASLSAPVLGLQAAAQIALGQKDRAREAYSTWLKQDPKNMLVRQRLVGLLVDAGDYEDARDVVKAGIALAPRAYQLLLDYVMIDLRATGLDAAMAAADNLISQDSGFTPALALKGDIYMAANRPDDAIQAYGTAMATAPSTLLLMRLVTAELHAGKAGAARDTVTNWLIKHPDDTVALEQSAELDIAQGQLPDAAQRLQAILKEKPHDPIALNNLAWVYQHLNNPHALDIARQAYVLSPGPQTADTLGWILTISGKASTGVMLLRQASVEAANDPSVQYHYAVALNDTGDKAQAIKLLTALVAVKADYKDKAAAQQLLTKLKGT